MAQSILVTLDGTVLDPDTPFLHADDLAAVRGDGIFETLLIRDGHARCVDLHLDRLARSAVMLDLPAPDRAAWQAAIDVAATTWTERAGNRTEGLLRLVYSRGRESTPAGPPTAYLTVGEVAPRAAAARESGVSVVTLDRGFSLDLAEAAPWQLLGAKTLSYATNMAALRYAGSLGYDDVIYVSSEGAVLEGPRSTVVAVTGETLVTPPVEVGILPGTTQLATFALAESEGWATQTRVLRPADLLVADSVWLISSVTLAARVTALNGRAMPEPEDAKKFVDLVNRAICVQPE
ncbi:aminodeoxychorismate lyase [Gordonia desulfuricans]|uniref:Aminodeoxychorismate lyase n=1 Tax=Gordonia desulfuricans TaxID=89051 RepID=A0A7K3LKL3_9ACTN|nr:aminodeoxychorismate lyase [Gordonia desulfuricans]NDK88748.1 aminodeoxychorismate lyase [Gordonia desulfuricans]